MYENERCCCDEAKLTPTKESESICSTAVNLLGCLRHIEEMMDRLEKTLFNTEFNKEERSEPDCLDSNIAIALDSAKSIACRLDKMVGRL